MTTKFICVSGDFYLRADKTLHVEDLFARKLIYLRANKFFGVNVEHVWLLPSIRSPLPPQHNPPPSLSATAAAMVAAMVAG
jgi:hypothetical protein